MWSTSAVFCVVSAYMFLINMWKNVKIYNPVSFYGWKYIPVSCDTYCSLSTPSLLKCTQPYFYNIFFSLLSLSCHRYRMGALGVLCGSHKRKQVYNPKFIYFILPFYVLHIQFVMYFHLPKDGITVLHGAEWKHDKTKKRSVALIFHIGLLS